jgi:two-component system chemotaxis response regulator CheY
VVILDWQMPGLDGAGFLRIVGSPDTSPHAGVPIIMLTGHGERSRVLEAIKVGVNEFLLKPASQNALRERLVAVLINPRPLVRHCDYYGRPRARWLPRRCTKTTTRQSPISTC